MNAYRYRLNPSDETEDHKWALSCAQAHYYLRQFPHCWDTAVIEKIAIDTSPLSIVQMLNGLQQPEGTATKAWTLTSRGAVKVMSATELAEFNEE